MKFITRDTDYAVRALCCIAQEPLLVCANKMVSFLKMPKPFLRKILQILNKKKLLISTKGKGGGFVLARSPDKITLIDVMRAFQGPVLLNECMFKKKVCPSISTCDLRKKLCEIQKIMIKQLESITIASLISKERKK
ncbi:MAG: Rrf2 family transcriptional regulator [bacterium]